MPWSAADAESHTSLAKTSALQQLWADTANGVLASTGDDVTAIRKANAAVHAKVKGPNRHHSKTRRSRNGSSDPTFRWL